MADPTSSPVSDQHQFDRNELPHYNTTDTPHF